jgi:Rrf2 family nitric oxide-sensitive transcriptional repressor
MRLTMQTDYSLRVLMYLGVAGEARVTIQEIADCFGISKNHLMKVVHQLGVHGYVKSVRGKNGGLSLAKPAEALAIGAVVRDTETDIALAECFQKGGACRIAPACRLTGILREAADAFFAVLDKYTLADLLLRPSKLEGLLGLKQAG